MGVDGVQNSRMTCRQIPQGVQGASLSDETATATICFVRRPASIILRQIAARSAQIQAPGVSAAVRTIRRIFYISTLHNDSIVKEQRGTYPKHTA